MAKTRQQKSAILDTYKDSISKSNAIFAIRGNFNGQEANELKQYAKEKNCYFTLIKNTLFRIAADENLSTKLDLKGPIFVFFCYDDFVEIAKKLAALKKEEKCEYLFCFVEGTLHDGSEIDKLSKVESREQTLAKILYLLDSGASGVVGSINAVMRDIAYLVEEVAKKQNQ
ncbi:MAG: 50S ribosomal protein L10 [Candidatus Dojkabacteria bacterium]|nr:50S ribosomal protein L10 [Candidatus Dojkabacteria bacterium]